MAEERARKRPVRISVLAANAEQARQHLRATGFVDFEERFKETLNDGQDVIVLILKLSEQDTGRLISAFPRELYAYRAIVGAMPPIKPA
jgi:hypothetical protein